MIIIFIVMRIHYFLGLFIFFIAVQMELQCTLAHASTSIYSNKVFLMKYLGLKNGWAET